MCFTFEICMKPFYFHLIVIRLPLSKEFVSVQSMDGYLHIFLGTGTLSIVIVLNFINFSSDCHLGIYGRLAVYVYGCGEQWIFCVTQLYWLSVCELHTYDFIYFYCTIVLMIYRYHYFHLGIRLVILPCFLLCLIWE